MFYSWNGAVVLPVRGVACALAAGCSIVIKASEMCPWTHQIILEVFEEAGLPPGVLNQVQTSREHAVAVTDALIAHPAIKKIEFIGMLLLNPVGLLSYANIARQQVALE
jgi:acyl-CoA reductase-like NAD-dependent aldehyde dehydrogenase